MIPSEKLEWFVIGFALELPNEGYGRPTSLTQLLLAAREKCGYCEFDHLLDVLYNLDPNDVELLKFPPNPNLRPVTFDRCRGYRRWHDFFQGQFNIKVLPKGRIRFERLTETKCREMS